MPEASRSARWEFADAGTVRIVQLSDFHFLADPDETLLGINTEQTFNQVLASVRARLPADLILATGDLAQDACEASYRRLGKTLTTLGTPCFCLPGNHDDPALIQATLVSESIHYQHLILLEHWQIICLDSSLPEDARGHLNDDQFALLEAALKENPERHALVALHHHPMPSDSEWMDTMVLQNAERLFKVMDPYPRARTLVCGHVHQAMDVTRDGFRLLSAPSTCFQFKPLEAEFTLDELPPGYRWLELFPDGRIETGVERVAALPDGLDFNSSGY